MRFFAAEISRVPNENKVHLVPTIDSAVILHANFFQACIMNDAPAIACTKCLSDIVLPSVRRVHRGSHISSVLLYQGKRGKFTIYLHTLF